MGWVLLCLLRDKLGGECDDPRLSMDIPFISMIDGSLSRWRGLTTPTDTPSGLLVLNGMMVSSSKRDSDFSSGRCFVFETCRRTKEEVEKV